MPSDTEKLKAELFDLTYEQSLLKIRFDQIERLKQGKLKELKEKNALPSR